MADYMGNYFKKESADGTIDLDNDTIKVVLVDSSYNGTKDTHYLGDTNIATSELSGDGYSRKTLANPAVTVDLANDRAEFDADDVLYEAIDAGTAAAAVIFKDTGNDATSTVIGYIDSGGFPFPTNGGNLTLLWNSEGILQLA